MSIVATKKLLFFLADDQNRTYYVEGGVVKKNIMPTWLKQNPNGWKDMTLQWATNKKYFSTIRQFSTAIKFVDDGEAILADRMINGLGTEEIMYLIILKQDPSMGLNGYRLEYKSRLDFSKFNGDPRTGISMNTLQSDVFALVQANENTIYPLQCNASNPAAIKVLFDGTLLQDKVNYQVVTVGYDLTLQNGIAIPLAFISNEGDNAGTIINSPNFETFPANNTNGYVSYPSNTNYPLSFADPTTVTLKGAYTFKVNLPGPFLFGPPLIDIFFMTNLQTLPVPAGHVIFSNSGLKGAPFALTDNTTYSATINITIPLAANEKLFFLLRRTGGAGITSVIPLSTTISALFSTKNDPTVNYGLRPLDVLKQLVSQITNGLFTADSNFLKNNNHKVVISGSSLRSFADAVIQTSFSDFFQSFSSAYNMGITVRNGVLFMEPVEDIYNSDQELMNLGNISEVTLTVAEEYVYTSAKVGYIKQTYNKRNGRYEYNCTHTYKFPINTVLNQLNLVSPYRADSFGMEFIRTGYPNLDSTDDKGDADVFTVMVSDSVGQTDGQVSTAVAVTIETLIIASPVIKTPFTNSTVYNQNPTVTGLSQPFKIITVYADGIVDGTTVANANGMWSYQIQRALQSLSTIFNGVHIIEANAQTDPLNISGFSNALTLIVNTMVQSPFLIVSPTNNDTLYNNLPIISGIAPSGAVITIKRDVVTLGTVIANSSGIWNYGVSTALLDGGHTITASSPLLPDVSISIIVNRNVSSPLITSLVYGDILYNNLPLIKGVAIPGTVVPVYLDGGGGPIVGGIAGPMGTATANISGDWSFQVVTVIDSGGFSTPYIPDGLHIVSTTSTPVNVLAAISGYRLMRGANKGPIMDYDTIKLDDAYLPIGVDPASLPATLGQFLQTQTLYNIEETTPLRMLRAHDNVLTPFLFQQSGKQILFNGAEVNANLVTKKDGVILNEGAAVNVNDLKPGLFYYWHLNFKGKVPLSFNQIMESLDNNGYITTFFKGVPIYVLPVGSMNMKLATDEAQVFKLLISTKTPLSSLLGLFSNGLSLSIGNNMIYLSDKNPLHFVRYNYTPPAGFHYTDIYDDWQKNRLPSHLAKSDYIQPWQNGDTIILQGINNGAGSVQVQLISQTTGRLVDTLSFVTVPGKIQLPNTLQQCTIPLAAYPEDQYWCAVISGVTIVAISELFWVKADWPDTMAFDYGGSTDKIDYYFSTGIQPRIRVQSLWQPWTPDSEVENYEDENGDFQITRGIPLKTKVLQLGRETSLISEWMALKMNVITLLDNVLVEGVQYTRDNNSKMEKDDLGMGISDCLYKMEMILAENESGFAFTTPGDTDINSVTWALDATAFGQNAGVINVTTN